MIRRTWCALISILTVLGGSWADATSGKRIAYSLMGYPQVSCEAAGCRRGHQLASEAGHAYSRRHYLIAARKLVGAARKLRAAICRPDPEFAGELFRALCYNASVSYLMARRTPRTAADLRRMAATDVGCAKGVREALRIERAPTR